MDLGQNRFPNEPVMVMDKLSIRVYDHCFAHATMVGGTGSLKVYPSYIDWYRGDDYRDISIYTNFDVARDISDSKVNIAWLIEPRESWPTHYSIVEGRSDEFDYIFTHDEALLGRVDNGVFMPLGGGSLFLPDCLIYPKTRNISAIVSDKKKLSGHKLRHDVVNAYRDKIDFLCGRGYGPIEYKLAGLKDFRYSFAIENSKVDYWFTEKVIDCFLTGTMPIYWGCPLDDFFNTDGIIVFDEISELEKVFHMDLEEFYMDNFDAVVENYYTALQYAITEDYMYLNFFAGKEF